MALRATLHDENDLDHPSIFCSCATHGASDTRRRQHKMLRLQEEGYFLSSSLTDCTRPMLLVL